MQSLVQIDLSNTNGEITTTSLEIARVFEKEHANVIKAIKSMSCSRDFYDVNFDAVEYLDKKGESRPSYIITRNGFDFLAMGFTGEKAAKYKEAYITEFDRMQRELRVQPTPIALAPATPTLPKLVLEFKAGIELAEILGFRHNQAIISANRAVEKLTGTDVMLLMGGTHLRAPVQAQTYTPTDLGKMLEVSASPRIVNRLLEEAGLQEGYRNHRGDLKWNLLEKGEAYGEYLDVEKVSGGAPVKQIKWYDTVVPLMEKELEFVS